MMELWIHAAYSWRGGESPIDAIGAKAAKHYTLYSALTRG
jgi:hypothetical protein